MKLVNCTGHVLHVYEGGRRVLTLPADGPLVRVDWRDLGDFDVAGVTVTDYAHLPVNLPTMSEGTWYVVSQVAALALLLAGITRPDVLVPGPGVSNNGRTVGCRGLRRVIA